MESTAQRQLTRLRSEDAFEICRYFEPTSAIQSFLTPNITSSLLIHSLTNNHHWFDAANVIAHSLQIRASLWWACLICRDHVVHASDPSSLNTLILMIEDWVKEPSEEKRLTVFQRANLLGNRSPGYWAGMATFWSMGNITPGSGIETPPPPYMYAKGVAACIDLAASLAISEREPFYRNSLARGIDLAAGGNGLIT